MTWEEQVFGLFDDLEQQAAAAYDQERIVDVLDRSRSEYQQVELASRLMASIGAEVALDLQGAGTITGRLSRVATGWCLVRGGLQDWVVPLSAILAVAGASERSLPALAWSPLARLALGSALRRLAEMGSPCVLHRIDGSRTECLLRRVGQDFVELEVGRGRVLLVTFAALAAVQSPEASAQD